MGTKARSLRPFVVEAYSSRVHAHAKDARCICPFIRKRRLGRLMASRTSKAVSGTHVFVHARFSTARSISVWPMHMRMTSCALYL